MSRSTIARGISASRLYCSAVLQYRDAPQRCLYRIRPPARPALPDLVRALRSWRGAVNNRDVSYRSRTGIGLSLSGGGLENYASSSTASDLLG